MEFKGILNISKEEALRRVKSLLWRIGMMTLALFVDFLMQNLTALQLSDQVVVILGLVLGEISKQLNKNYQVMKGVALKGKK